MDETKKTKDEPKGKNQLFEQMMEEGTMDSFLKSLPEDEQDEWKDFASKTLSHYDKIICMIRETTSTEKGKEQFYDELKKAMDK